MSEQPLPPPLPPFSPPDTYRLAYLQHTHTHIYTQIHLVLWGSKRGCSCGVGAESAEISLMKEQPITVHLAVHNSEKEEGGTDGAREQGGYRGRGVGGQRLKLHHKSHPERKHGVTPPPQPSTPLPSLPCGPALSSSPPLHLPPLPLFQRTECPMDRPGVFYITPSCTSNAKQPNFSSPPLLLIYYSFFPFPSIYQPVVRL